MKAALDVHYENDRAFAACILFEKWQDSLPLEIIRTDVPAAKPYQAGRFYLRELPCLLAVLQQAGQDFETILIDGFVHLQPEVGKGLGMHLYESLDYPAAVIGIAKRQLKVAEQFLPILRGRSKRPLYISAIGCSLDHAARSVASMHGPHRIPTLLKLVDQCARSP